MDERRLAGKKDGDGGRFWAWLGPGLFFGLFLVFAASASLELTIGVYWERRYPTVARVGEGLLSLLLLGGFGLAYLVRSFQELGSGTIDSFLGKEPIDRRQRPARFWMTLSLRLIWAMWMLNAGLRLFLKDLKSGS